MPRAAANSTRDTFVPLVLLGGDVLVTFAGLALGWWIRYASPLDRLGIDVADARFGNYLNLLLVGVALLIGSFAQFGLYDTRLLLRRYQSLNAILKGSAFWLVSYLGLSLVLKFDPPISRLFVIEAFVCTVVLLFVWRSLAYAAVAGSPLLAQLRRRAILLGWNADARALATEIARDPAHPFSLAGYIRLAADTTPPFTASQEARDDWPKETSLLASVNCLDPLGEVRELESILKREKADVLIITRFDLPRAELRAIVETCERTYIEWKIVPGAFDIFLSGLRLQTIGHVPVLGVEGLTINRLFNRGIKRAVDVVSAVVGLLLSIPLMAVFAALIKAESPRGPVLFRQTRIGAGHRPFTLYKLRSMQPGADASDAARQSTAPGDARLLRIGAFLRRWNLDELPQFWNVLRGEMSLVGPRPERPYHVDQLAETIPHYLPRHVAKPGMTGWAQVHGLRGESDLTARVQHDIYYIENWSFWLDVQIVLLTFIRWRNDSAY
ncbi:MAG: exopolysaccharide biosynthesis polyprenyl glycosylphosphotransferase [Opitutaceae bacterium]